MRTAYLDCFAGISGDMLLASLLDAGLPPHFLQEQLNLLQLEGYTFRHSRVTRGGLAACQVQIAVSHDQPHRKLADIEAIISASSLSDAIKKKSLAVFDVLATAEAKVHGISREEVHFHEVGGVDAIIDIVGAAVGFNFFKIERILASPLPLGRGFVKCAHGTLPLPAPAVVELCQGLDLQGVDIDQELVTPTGAAIIKGLAVGTGPLPPLRLAEKGYGAGSRELSDGRPNLLRLLIGEEEPVAEEQEVEVIECQLDDWAGETFPWLSEKLFAARALDVSLSPLQMKKGRPGWLLRVIVGPGQAHACKEIILTETTAIGLRFRQEQRLTLPRRPVEITTPHGKLIAKEVETPAGPRIYPEYEECCRLAREKDLPLATIYTAVLKHG
ncbi:MAG: nickel pincer cofactor biosynthesis protein LarC [Thermodesulfobacteriota bacterium]